MMRTELRFTLSDGKKTPRNGEIVFLMIFKPWPRSISIPWHQFPAILLLATLFLAGASVNDMGGPAVPDSHLIPDYMNLTTSKHSVWLQHPRDSNRVPKWPGELPELTQPLNSYGPVPCHSKTWEHGCSLHDDGKFLACRISLEFPNSNFIQLWWLQW